MPPSLQTKKEKPMLCRKLTCLTLFFLAATLFVSPTVQAAKSVGDLKQVESKIQDLVQKTLPCTVCVASAGGQGSGSGVIVSEDGLVLTAAHVIQAAGKQFVVIFPDGRKVKAKSLGLNRSRDAGMVQITESGKYPFVKVGKSSELDRNDWCVSLGHAGGFQADRSPPVRMGRVLANGRFVVTDCTIIAGDSGGPLFDLQGRLIGIHSNIGESLSQNQHVPIDVFTADWDRMKKGESWGAGFGGGNGGLDPRQPVMGVQLSPEPNDDGIIIGGVTPNSPAERAGLKVRDVVTKVDGKKVSTAQDMIQVVKEKRAGDKVKLDVKRGDEALTFDVRLVRAGQLFQRDRQPDRRRPQRRRPPTEESDDGKQSDSEKESKDKENKSSNSADENKKNADAEAGSGQSDESEVEAKPEKDSEEKVTGKDDGPQANKDDKRVEGRSIEELIREARRSGGRLELTPEERQRVQKFMQERFLGGNNRNGIRPPLSQPDQWYSDVMKAYEPVVAIANDSTYRVLVDGEQVALGTAVSGDTLLTKASEIDEADFKVELARRNFVGGEVVKVFKKYDLALIRVSRGTVRPIDLDLKSGALPLGTFLASVGNRKRPEAIGLISVKTREFASAKGFLGIFLDKVDAGIIIRDVSRRSPASRAGLKVDDVILKLDEKSYSQLPDLIGAVGSHAPGEEVKLLVKRGDEELTLIAKLGIRQANPGSRMERMNQMGSELSETRSGFPMALQHDCPISPNACGGPVVNLDGEVVGINIARAGRIKSYALPLQVIQQLLVQVEEAETEATTN